MRILLAALSIVLLASGCSESVVISVESDAVHVGERVHVYVYELDRGYDAHSVTCSNDPDDDTLTVDDPSILAVENLHRRESRDAYDPQSTAAEFAITALRAGDAILSTRCGALVGTQVVHVSP